MKEEVELGFVKPSVGDPAGTVEEVIYSLLQFPLMIARQSFRKVLTCETILTEYSSMSSISGVHTRDTSAPNEVQS
jgi:hypothetical protein